MHEQPTCGDSVELVHIGSYGLNLMRMTDQVFLACKTDVVAVSVSQSWMCQWDHTVNVKGVIAVVRCISVSLGIHLAERESLSFGIILGEAYSQCGIARPYIDVMSVSFVCIPERKGLAARTSEAILAGLGS